MDRHLRANATSWFINRFNRLDTRMGLLTKLFPCNQIRNPPSTERAVNISAFDEHVWRLLPPSYEDTDDKNVYATFPELNAIIIPCQMCAQLWQDDKNVYATFPGTPEMCAELRTATFAKLSKTALMLCLNILVY